MVKNAATNALMLVAVTLAAGLLAELGYRLYLFGPAAFSFAKVNSVRPIGLSGLLRPSEHSEIVFELKPGLDTYFKLARVQTNSRGLRDREHAPAKPQGTFRVAVIGDSYTMPAGVEIEEAFHSRIEAGLNEEAGHRPYEFLNFAVGGYSLRQYLGVLRHKVARYDPDLVIVGFCPVNDHLVQSESLFSEPWRPRRVTNPFFGSFMLDGLVRRLAHRPAKENGRPVFTERQAAYLRDVFARMAEFSGESGAPVVVAKLGTRPQRAYTRELAAIVSESGLPFVDLGTAFEGLDSKAFRIHPGDAHPNAEAHAVFADELLRYLREKGLLERSHQESPGRPTAWTEPVVGMEFVRLESGSFTMGTPCDEPMREAQEALHQVTLTKPFYLGRYEVTQAQWVAVVGENPSHFGDCGPDCPVESVSYDEIREFVAAYEVLAGERFRLPTEAEWEYACRAGGSGAFGIADRVSSNVANFDGSVPYPGAEVGPDLGRPAAVGSYAPNGWGLYDMNGNVWEWTEDDHCDYPEGAVVDPLARCGAELRVIRGGSWYFGADSARCGLRYTHRPVDDGPSLGFRLVRVPPPVS